LQGARCQAAALEPALVRYEINTNNRIAAFLAQTGYESGQFNRVVENLNYSTAKRLMAVRPKRFPTEDSARPYANNPEELANFVYAGRLGNGNTASGDGFRYHGRGLIQLTGRSNYQASAKALEVC
jgi:putative chitinase